MEKIKSIIFILLIIAGFFLAGCNSSETEKHTQSVVTENHSEMKMMHNHMVNDDRISLHLSQKKAQHQLMNMRNHLKAVQSIIDYLAKNNFDSASMVASSKLGLTNEMKMMCSSFGNKEFERLGLGFHKSADRMSEIIKTKDKTKSFEALSSTLNYCVTCHSTFKQ